MTARRTSLQWQRQTYLFLHNWWVLFALFLLAMLMIIYLACHQDLLSILVLFLVGFIVYFFTSNMVVVITIAIVFTGLIRFTNIDDSFQIHLGSQLDYPWHMVEGMTNDIDISDSGGGGQVYRIDKTEKLEPEAAPIPSKLLEQTFSSSSTTSADLEKLRLQKEILEKVERMEPLISTVTRFSGLMKDTTATATTAATATAATPTPT